MSQNYSGYTKEIHTKSTAIARELLPLLVEDITTYIPDFIETQEEKDALMEKTLDCGNKVMAFMSTKDIPARYATMSIDKIIDALTGLKTFIDGTLNMHEDEYLSRSYGVKDEKGKYRREVVTIAQMVLKLDEVRKATGDQRSDFFNEAPPAVESPYVPETPGETVA